MAALRELAGGRADLLAEAAGLLEGASEGELDEPLARGSRRGGAGGTRLGCRRSPAACTAGVAGNGPGGGNAGSPRPGT